MGRDSLSVVNGALQVYGIERAAELLRAKYCL
jgi:hypothetical protein